MLIRRIKKSLSRLAYLLLLCLPTLGDSVLASPVAENNPKTTILNLTETAETVITPDELVAVLGYTKTDTDTVRLQNIINRAVGGAIDKAKNFPPVLLHTTRYQVNKVRSPIRGQKPNSEEEERWEGWQTVRLISSDHQALLRLADQLQTSGFVMQALQYQVSAALYDTTKESLLEGAIQQLNGKINRTKTALKMTNVHIEEVTLDPGKQGYLHSGLRVDVAHASFESTPVAKAGTSAVSLTISARVRLQ